MADKTETITELREDNQSLAQRLKSMRKQAERGIESVVHVGLAGGTGFALGLAAANNEENPGQLQEYSDVPVSVIAGVVAHGFALTTKKDSMAGYFQTIGNTSLGIAAFEYGKTKGKEWKEEDQTPGVGSAPRRGARSLRDGIRAALDRVDTVSDSHGMSRLPVTEYKLSLSTLSGDASFAYTVSD